MSKNCRISGRQVDPDQILHSVVNIFHLSMFFLNLSVSILPLKVEAEFFQDGKFLLVVTGPQVCYS